MELRFPYQLQLEIFIGGFVQMEDATKLLETIREFEIEKYETEQELREELDKLVTVKYDGSFSTFMEKEVLNEDYGSLKSEVERLYFS